MARLPFCISTHPAYEAAPPLPGQQQRMQPRATQRQACERCWRRKQKCDKQSPACADCVKARVPCVPRHHARTSSVVDEEGHVNISSIEVLKRKIAELERLSDTQSASEVVSSLSSARAGDDRDVNESEKEAQPATEEQLMESAVDEVVYLSLNAFGGEDESSTAIGNICYATFVSKALTLSGSNPSSACLKGSNTGTFDRWLIEQKPVKPTLVGLNVSMFLQRFTDWASLSFPYLTDAVCAAAVDAMKAAESNSVVLQYAVQEPQSFAVANIGVALGILMSEQSHTAINYARSLIDRVQDTLFVQSQIKSDWDMLYVLTLYTIASMFEPDAGPMWYLLGMAMTKSLSLGLHCDNPEKTAATLPQEETSIFWSLYIADRTVAFVMDRPFSVEESDMTKTPPPLPVARATGSPKAIIDSVFTCTIHHAQLLSEWRQVTLTSTSSHYSNYQYWQELYHHLQRKALYHGLISQNEQYRTFIQIHGERLTCRALIQLLSHLISQSTPNPDLESRLASDICSKVRQFVASLQTLVDKYHFSLPFLDAYEVFACGIAFVYVFILNTNQIQFSDASADHPISYSTLVLNISNLISEISTRFKPLKDFGKVFLAFERAMACRFPSVSESPARNPVFNPTVSDAVATLRLTIDRSAVVVPAFMITLMRHAISHNDAEVARFVWPI